jgi:N-acetylmuramoyl-L-alanine amidase
MSTVANSVYAGGKIETFKAPLIVKEGVFYISEEALVFIAPFLSYEFTSSKEKDSKNKKKTSKKIIFIDPGHGGDGKDGLGAVGVLDGKTIYEKEVVLNFSKILGAALISNGYDVKYMRKDNDTKISLLDRINKVNKSGANLFISIHANSSATDKTAKGVDVFYMSEEAGDNYSKSVAEAENMAFSGEKASNEVDSIINSMLISSHIKEGAKLAAEISSKIPKGVMNRGVKKAPFAVLSRVMVPAVLIEIGFMSNEEDLKRMKNDSEMKKLAENIAKGIKSYLSKYKV